MTVGWQIDQRPFSPQASQVSDLASMTAPAADELFRWAQFLAQGEELSRARHRAIDALLEAGDYNRDAIYAARLYALRALGRGIGTRDVVDLLQAALDASQAHAESA